MEKNENLDVTAIIEENNPKKKNKKSGIVLLIIVLVAILSAIGYIIYPILFEKTTTRKTDAQELYLENRIKSNSLEDFDLYFLKAENNKKNTIYSPLSIKYALAMIQQAADEDSKKQIEAILGDYKASKYTNSKNLSLANAFFVKNDFKDSIKEAYINSIKEKYNASVVYDSFATADNINKWVKDNTLGLISNITDDVSNKDFILLNALGIDMEWVNKIQSENEYYFVNFIHTKINKMVGPLTTGMRSFTFNNDQEVLALEIAAVANKYDIVKTLGEDKIKETIKTEYNKFIAEGGEDENYKDADDAANSFLKDLKESYELNHISSSTDFSFYADEDIKVISKDLKEYDGNTLQYIAIMPEKEDLDEYITNTSATKVKEIINKIKPIELDSFEDGYVTMISGDIPTFKYNYQLDLMNDLKKLGIEDIFNNKADLSNMTSKNSTISSIKHKANIEFTNNGIKASAALCSGGGGAASTGFDYSFDVPVKEINLSFDKPYMYFIINKDTKEVWFTGTVYNPTIYNADEIYNNDLCE